MNLSIKCKTKKHLEHNIGENLNVFGCGNYLGTSKGTNYERMN